MTDECTHESHAAIQADPFEYIKRMRHVRPWRDADLVLADCDRCKSTLSISLSLLLDAIAHLFEEREILKRMLVEERLRVEEIARGLES